jgi:tetratricopeptide (TPR) repeat protein
MADADAQSEIEGSLTPTSKHQAMLLLESGYLSMDLGKFDDAREILVGAAALMPKSEVPQIALGTLEFNQGRFDKALQAFRAAQRVAPRAALPRAHAGEALLFMGKANEAMKELKKAVELEPQSDGAAFARALIEAKELGALPPPAKAPAP